ncbi:UDP-GlcNAc:betaGal beta-1,3-N-acetylglucosaminyltransferase 2-like [Stegastes partitus]|uniref:Hexosyltransferase n=1 Tax=Stegastes partitus TaxID=144197 RepID=A0A3B5BBZ1_9TELE|nr:PREDICTED: UDP-GlcNAc:betaGal beta-1,3-N-acetylglucosaminyltransferase 2-like [Stegastes partitus]
MAQFSCRWRNVFICVCTPCLCMLLLFFYAGIVMCMRMKGVKAPWTPENPQFVAPGISEHKGFAPIPKAFWRNELHQDAFWNQLQLDVDRSLNPILRPSATKRGLKGSKFSFLLRQSFSEAKKQENMKKIFHNLPPHIQRFVNYMQRRTYPIVLQPDGECGAQAKEEKQPPLILFAIKTEELNFKNRQAIRQTWGRAGWVAGQKRNGSAEEEVGGYVRRVFLLGKENPDDLGVNISELLRMENEHYGDILQWDFDDTFSNLTLKDVLFWRWFSRSRCPTVFVFKGDDDVFVNTPNLITYLWDQLVTLQANKTLKDFMVGDVIAAAAPNREDKSKYFIPESFYSGRYPRYAGGGGVVYSSLLAKRLNLISKRVHLYPIDDVYVGMCMLQLNAFPVHHPAFLTFDFPGEEEKQPCSYHKILLVHKRNPEHTVRLWSDLKQTQTQCKDVSLRVDVKKKNISKP